VAIGQVLFRILRFSRQYRSTNAPYSSSSTRRSYQRDKRAKSGNLPKSNAFSKVGEHWIESTFTFLRLQGVNIIYVDKFNISSNSI
jgi:hypothetical protein